MYDAKVRRNQGGRTLEVASGGKIDVKSGGTVVIADAAGLTINGVALGAVVASGTQHAHIIDITTTATGTEISTAVNAILAALEAFKINAAA
jgi:hypothetical protein